MKKISILLSCCLLFGCIQAQNIHHRYGLKDRNATHFTKAEQMIFSERAQYYMSGYYTDDNYETCSFYFDNNNRLIAVYSEFTGEYMVIDTLRYNDAGQMVRLEGYQWLNNEWKNVYYIDYTYNAAGLIASRTNYNWLNNEWTLGGVYEYSYNPSNQIILTELFLGNQLFQTIDYSYYDNGLLKTELWSDAGFYSTYPEPSEKYTYYYEGTQLQYVLDSIVDFGWEYDGREEFEYDNNGNCTLRQTLDQNGDVTEKSIYEFESRLVDNTLIPSHPELTRPFIYNNVNTYNREHWYALDVEHVLQYVCDYIYDYSTINAIPTPTEASLNCYPNPANNMLNIDGNDGATVRIYDMAGRLVQQSVLDSQRINVSNLLQGSYLLQLDGENGTKSCHFVIAR